MPFLFQPFHLVLVVLCESIRKEQERVIEYLQLENQILREKIGGNRVLLSDDQRRRLAVKGKVLGRRQLGEVATIAQADTVLRWHRELIENPVRRSNTRHRTGRPRIDQEVVGLVLRMASENESWGYKRIQGALGNVGFRICTSSVANILKAHGIEPAPTRGRTTSWTTFLKSHWDVFQEFDLDAITLWFSELIRCVLESVSDDNAVVGDAAVGSNDVASCLVMLTVPVLQKYPNRRRNHHADRHPLFNLQPLTANFVTQLNRCVRDTCALVATYGCSGAQPARQSRPEKP